MPKLYLCEKPSQARDIARVLEATKRNDGFFEGNGAIVTWCFGHLLEMAAPHDYDPALKLWKFETLPIIPNEWILNVRKDARKQYKIIVSLFKRSEEIVVSTDADREGEAIAREIIEMARWNGPVTRLWLSALDDKSIKQGLDNLLPGEKTVNLYHAASARSKADWLVGMTLSRLYTLSAQQSGYEGVMSVGRVQTPTLKLVVDRDRIIDSFVPVPFFDVFAYFNDSGKEEDDAFVGKWKVPDDVADEDSRCLSQSSAELVATRCLNQQAIVTVATEKRVRQSAPLLHSLSDLQQEASRRFGMGAQTVLDIAQALYETHKVTSYPRTDCQYLPQSQISDASQIIKTLQAMADYKEIAGKADAGFQSKVWNDKKITAHHAIIPTGVKPSSQLTDAESKVFDLICRRYLAQFYSLHEFDQTHIELSVGENRFHVTGKQVVVRGWKEALQTSFNHKNKEPAAEKELPVIRQGDCFNVVNIKVEDKQTQSPERYTEGTLIQAMKNIGKFVENAVLRKRLKETSGIGTEATRASIIEVLLKRQFIGQQGKKYLVSSAQAQALIDALPTPVKDPATTAVWEQALEEIAQGNGNAEQFVSDQALMVTRLTERVKQDMPDAFKAFDSDSERFDCPSCDHTLVRRKGKSGFFWGCRNFPECNVVLPDDKGKPGKAKEKAQSTEKTCPECEKGTLLKRKVGRGKKIGKTFLGCSRYPECSHTEG